jgi:hypothetical protein
MQTRTFLAAALIAATPAFAQEPTTKPKPAAAKPEAAGHDMQNPKTKEHELLKSLAGTWECTVKSEAMPGVPGMEKATEQTCTEYADLINDGLWLKSTLSTTWQGKPFEGIWLVGYDPAKKGYTGIWVDSMESGACEMNGTFDAAKKTWAWNGKTPKGDSRSVVVVKDADNSVETCYLKPTGTDKELQVMQITRKRIKTAQASDATAAKPAADLPEPYKLLQREVGTWDATMKMAMDPSAPPSEEKGVEVVKSVCAGKFCWTDFKGQMMGQPFEGHALFGYDENQKKYIGFWFDSMTAGYASIAGNFDAAKKTLTMEGTCPDPTGKPGKMKEVITYKDNDTKVCNFEFISPEGTHKMEITYKRKSAPAKK